MGESFEKRCTEAKRILAKHPDRVPVICEREVTVPGCSSNFRKKLLVPESMSVGELKKVVRKHVEDAKGSIAPHQSIQLFVKDALRSEVLVSELYETSKAADGFLYITFCVEVRASLQALQAAHSSPNAIPASKLQALSEESPVEQAARGSRKSDGSSRGSKGSSEAKRILAKYPGRIPVICVTEPGSDLPSITKKFLIPEEMKCEEFKVTLRKHIEQNTNRAVSSDQRIRLAVDDLVQKGEAIMSDVYHHHAADDGFLRMVYSIELCPVDPIPTSIHLPDNDPSDVSDFSEEQGREIDNTFESSLKRADKKLDREGAVDTPALSQTHSGVDHEPSGHCDQENASTVDGSRSEDTLEAQVDSVDGVAAKRDDRLDKLASASEAVEGGGKEEVEEEAAAADGVDAYKDCHDESEKAEEVEKEKEEEEEKQEEEQEEEEEEEDEEEEKEEEKVEREQEAAEQELKEGEEDEQEEEEVQKEGEEDQKLQQEEKVEEEKDTGVAAGVHDSNTPASASSSKEAGRLPPEDVAFDAEGERGCAEEARSAEDSLDSNEHDVAATAIEPSVLLLPSPQSPPAALCPQAGPADSPDVEIALVVDAAVGNESRQTDRKSAAGGVSDCDPDPLIVEREHLFDEASNPEEVQEANILAVDIDVPAISERHQAEGVAPTGANPAQTLTTEAAHVEVEGTGVQEPPAAEVKRSLPDTSGPKDLVDKRSEEARRMLSKYPDRIPVICEKAPRTDLPDIDKNKFLVPGTMHCSEFKYTIHKHVRQATKRGIASEQTIYLFVQNTSPKPGALMSELYERYKADDGFLYITYGVENTLG